MPRVICMPKWARVEKADSLEARRVVDDIFALGVSLRSSDYITKEDLRSYELAFVDDENSDGPPVALSSGIGVPPNLATNTPPAASLTMPHVVPSSVPQAIAGPPVAPTSGATTG